MLQVYFRENVERHGMMENETINYKIRSAYALMRKSEKKVADYVLENELACSKISLEKLSKRSNVSQPTVVRFVKALGYDSFKEFRYNLLEEITERDKEKRTGNVLQNYSIEPGEAMKFIPAKVIASSVEALENMLKSISCDEFTQIVKMISKAKKIVICAVENSTAVAKDLMTKLLYLGYDCRFDEDYYIQHVMAGALTPEDVMIGISYSGQSKDTVDIMKAAKKAGAQTIAITNFEKSRIAKWSDAVLCSSQKQWMYGECIFSRSSQMVINDMIYAGLVADNYDSCTQNLDKNSEIIQNRGYDM